MGLTDLIAAANRRGFTHNFAYDADQLHCEQTGECFSAGDARIVDSSGVDAGTDPGDEATVYLIETSSGVKGYLITADSFHTDPQKAAFIDALK